MMSGFVMPTGHVHHLPVGGASGGDDARFPWGMQSVHELDAVVPATARRSKRPAAAGGLEAAPFQCLVCDRTFNTKKAVYGHIAVANGKRYRYVCDRFRAPFETRQALGGHRASHNGKKGCSWYSKQELAEAAAAGRAPIKHAWDLNDPAPKE